MVRLRFNPSGLEKLDPEFQVALDELLEAGWDPERIDQIARAVGRHPKYESVAILNNWLLSYFEGRASRLTRAAFARSQRLRPKPEDLEAEREFQNLGPLLDALYRNVVRRIKQMRPGNRLTELFIDINGAGMADAWLQHPNDTISEGAARFNAPWIFADLSASYPESWRWLTADDREELNATKTAILNWDDQGFQRVDLYASEEEADRAWQNISDYYQEIMAEMLEDEEDE